MRLLIMVEAVVLMMFCSQTAANTTNNSLTFRLKSIKTKKNVMTTNECVQWQSGDVLQFEMNLWERPKAYVPFFHSLMPRFYKYELNTKRTKKYEWYWIFIFVLIIPIQLCIDVCCYSGTTGTAIFGFNEKLKRPIAASSSYPTQINSKNSKHDYYRYSFAWQSMFLLECRLHCNDTQPVRP